MKTLLVIPDSVGVRNFLCSRFPHLLIEEGEVFVWHSLPAPSVNFFRQRFDNRLQWEQLPSYTEPLLEYLLRYSKIWAQLHAQNDFALEVASQNLRLQRSRKHQIVSRGAKQLSRLFANQAGVQRLDRIYKYLVLQNSRTQHYESYLRETKPDIVFCTHQRAHKAVPAMLAAQKLGIPTATFIYSWDNLPKGRMAVSADYFFVWSSFMKEEMKQYYPDVSQDRVIITGTPQFEGYFNEAWVKPRERFLAEWGADPQRPVICFSGSDLTTSPHDPVFLADLAQALRAIPESQRPQIVFRRTPVDWSPRYNATFKQFPEIIVSDPLWSTEHSNGDWTQYTPAEEDVILLSNLAHHADLVINMGSTMAMDFAITGKPAIYIAYNPPNRLPYWDIELVYQMLHFKPIHRMQPVYWAKSSQELAGLVQHVLQHPQEKAPERRAWLQSHTAQPLNEASLRCCLALKQLAQQRTPLLFESEPQQAKTLAAI